MPYRWKLKEIDKMSEGRPEGYKEDLLASGTIQGDYLIVSGAARRDLLLKYDPQRLQQNPIAAHISGSADPSKLRGLGDVVHAIAHPLARFVDKVAGTNFQNCGGCNQRREKFNKAVPFTKSENPSG